MKRIVTTIMSATLITGIAPTIAVNATPQPTTKTTKVVKLTAKQKKALVHQRKVKDANVLRVKLVTAAKKRLKGRGRYVAGASSAWRFDCSGFTKYLYKSVLKKNIPHYSGAQMRQSKRINKRNLRPGDLLFWGRSGSQHVSMYIGKGKMIGANNPRSNVVIESINAPWWRSKYAGAGQPSKKLLAR